MKVLLSIGAALVALALSNGAVFAETVERFGTRDLDAAIASLPSESRKPLEEVRLIDTGMVGVRVFRVYNVVPRHSHRYSSTYLTIRSGRGILRIEGGKEIEAGAGDMVFWERGVEHEIVKILEHPYVFIAVDAPVRRQGDVLKRRK